MAGIVLAATLFITAAAVAFTRWRESGESSRFVLRLLPAALLFVSLPAWLSALDMLRLFQRIAATNGGADGGGPQVEALAGHANTTLLTGLVAMVVAVAIAAGLQAFASRNSAPAEQGTSPAERIEAWLLVAPSLAALPTAFVAVVIHRVTALLALAAARVAADSGTTVVAGMPIAELSNYIAQRLLVVLMMGGATNLAMLALVPALLLLVRSPRPRGHLDTYAWVVLAVVVGAGVWGAFVVGGDTGVSPALPAVHGGSQ